MNTGNTIFVTLAPRLKIALWFKSLIALQRQWWSFLCPTNDAKSACFLLFERWSVVLSFSFENLSNFKDVFRALSHRIMKTVQNTVSIFIHCLWAYGVEPALNAKDFGWGINHLKQIYDVFAQIQPPICLFRRSAEVEIRSLPSAATAAARDASSSEWTKKPGANLLRSVKNQSTNQRKRPVAEHAVAAARHWLWTRRGHSKKDELWGQGSSIHISILYYLVCSDRQIIDIIIINHHLRSVPLRYGVEVSVRCKKGAVWTPALPAFRMFSFNQTLIFFLPTFRKANPGGQTVA